MDRMFPFITETWNPMCGGPCPYDCSYCWAKGLINRFKYQKYQGPFRLDPKVKIPDKGFIFVQDMSDISCLNLDESRKLFRWLIYWSVPRYLFLTKNPNYYRELHLDDCPFGGNMVLGATIETDNPAITNKVSKAPNPWRRLEAMKYLARNVHTPLFVSVEPIMRFTEGFANDLLELKPFLWGVAVGYDNYHNELDEPCLSDTEKLITKLERAGIQVFRKTIREANHLTIGMEDRGEK